MKTLPLHLLPKTLQDIAETCGVDTMWALWAAYGGRHLVVPKQPAADHPLRAVLNERQLLIFCELYGLELIVFPKAQKAQNAVRNVLIHQLHCEGKTQCSLARQFDLTERMVNKILNMNLTATANAKAREIEQLDVFADSISNGLDV